MSASDNIVGSLLGLAIGDALGAPVDGMKAGHIQQTAGEVVDYVDNRALWPDRPSHWRRPGLYGSAAQQALALADVLGDYGQADLEALADLWTRLLRANTGRPIGAHRSPGACFFRAVRAMADGAPPLESGVPSAGNGAAKRIAPAALFFRDDEAALLESVALFSLATHTDPRAIAAAAALARAIAQLLTMEEPLKPDAAADLARAIQAFTRRAEESLQDNFFDRLHKETRLEFAYAMSDALDVLAPIVRERNPDLARKTIVKEANRRGPAQPISDANVGFAPASVMAALYHAMSAPSFFHGMIAAINDGRDTAAAGAMTGALLGARFGAAAIPSEWSAGLLNADQFRLRSQYLANREVDYMTRDDYVEMETRLTLDELQFFAEDLKKARAAMQEREQKRAKSKSQTKEQPINLDQLGFAPPPEVWLAMDDLAPEDKRREKERRARRRIDWKETRREVQRLRTDNDPDVKDE